MAGNSNFCNVVGPCKNAWNLRRHAAAGAVLTHCFKKSTRYFSTRVGQHSTSDSATRASSSSGKPTKCLYTGGRLEGRRLITNRVVAFPLTAKAVGTGGLLRRLLPQRKPMTTRGPQLPHGRTASSSLSNASLRVPQRCWRRCEARATQARPGPSAQADSGVVAPAQGRVQRLEAKAPSTEGKPAPAAPAPTPPEQPARFKSLYNWLRFGGLPVKAAGSPVEPQAALQHEPEDQLWGDGMAAGALTVPPSSSSLSHRSRFYKRSSSQRQAQGDQAQAAPALQQQLDPSHPTLALLRQRLSEGSRPGKRNDSFKLGLVVEGGGMRGCVSGGGLQALTDLGMRNAFDAVYGSSAGAINSTYFLSGQRQGVEIYHDHIAHNEFIDLKRLWRSEPGGAPVLNLPYLIDYVMHHVMPLDWDAVVNSDIPLKVVASSLDTLQPVILDNFACKDDLAISLRASAKVPEIAGPYIIHRGHRLVDAAVFEPVPFRSAIADGCTHILVLCTRPKREGRGLREPLEDAIEAALKRSILSPDYMVPAWRAEMEYLAKDGISQDEMLLRSFDEDAHELPWFAGTHVYPLYPGPAAVFSPLCTDVPTLKGGVAEGRRVVMQLARSLMLWDEAVPGEDAELAPREEHLAIESNIMPLPMQLASSAAAAGAGARSRLALLWGR